MRGRIQRFLLDTLVGMLEKLGVRVAWHFEETESTRIQ